MALNSFITREGLEMGRAQVMQAEAAGIVPDVRMNPVLLKPTTDTGSQVIVRGEVLGHMDARRYFAYKKGLMPMILEAYRSLSEEYDIIVIEGAGSPAEINLKSDDIVNMGLAKAVGAPVLLVGDIDRGGVFAQLLGTHMLLEPDEQALLKGFIINKFRGDKTILDPGVRMLEERGGVPVVGVVPYMQLDLDDEDSLSPQLEQTNRPSAGKPVEIAVIRLPHLSNFTDFNVFLRIPEVDLRYVSRPGALGDPDMVILPGTKNTIEDLLWLKESGMASAIDALRQMGRLIFGICGGFQMLGRRVSDPEGMETGRAGASVDGLGFLDAETVFFTEKRRTRVSGIIGNLSGILSTLNGMAVVGYEIHMGQTGTNAADLDYGEAASGSSVLSGKESGTLTVSLPGKESGTLSGKFSETEKPETDSEKTTGFAVITDQRTGQTTVDGLACRNVCGTYIHGVFDAPGIARRIVRTLGELKGLDIAAGNDAEIWENTDPDNEDGDHPDKYKEAQYDALADTLRLHLDMEKIYRILEEGAAFRI